VVLEGDGLARRWVERALRREGWAAIDRAADAATRLPEIARVVIAEGVPHYRVEIDGASFDCASIGELVRRLRSAPGAR
jgi:hypothetical protein